MSKSRRNSNRRKSQPAHLELLENRQLMSADGFLNAFLAIDPHQAYLFGSTPNVGNSVGDGLSGGTVSVWGNNSSQQLAVPAGTHYTAISAGFAFCLALRSDGTLAAWGSNDSGQLTVPAGSDFTAVAAAGRSGVALRADGSLVAWGDNMFGQCNVPEGNDFTAIASGSYWGMALRSDGTLVAWGDDSFGEEVSRCPTDGGYTAIACGNAWGMALKADGTIKAWGVSLGNPVRTTPTDANYTAIAGGLATGLAIRKDGSLFAWGDNSCGQTNVPAGANFVAISSKGLHSVAMRADGTIVAWGDNADSMNVVGTGQYSLIAAGTSNTLALKAAQPTAVQVNDADLSYVEGNGAVAIDGTLTVTGDATTLSGATVTLINYVAGEDALSFTPRSGITAVWDDDAGTLTFTGTASLATYQTLLRSVKYCDPSQSPTAIDRSVEFVVNDGAADSDPATRIITVTPVNNRPIAQGQSIQITPGDIVTLTLVASDAETPFDGLLFNVPDRTAHGTLTPTDEPGQYEYQPDDGYIGLDSFTYTVSDDGDPSGSYDNPADLTSMAATVTISAGNVLVTNSRGTCSFRDSNGTLVTVTLHGSGRGTLYFDQAGNADLDSLVVTGTTDKSSLSITTSGRNSATTLGDITVTGPIASITATTSDISGNVTIGAAVSSTAAVTINFDQVAETSITSAMPIRSIRMIEWLDMDDQLDTITAPWIGTITTVGRKNVSTGDFMADVHLTAAGPKNVSLAGLTVAGWLDGSRITTQTGIGTVTVGGMRDSDIFAGVADVDNILGLPDPTMDFDALATAAAIKTVTIRGTMRDDAGFATLNANIAAPTISKITFAYASFDNYGSPWGFAMKQAWTRSKLSYRDQRGTHYWPNIASDTIDLMVLPGVARV